MKRPLKLLILAAVLGLGAGAGFGLLKQNGDSAIAAGDNSSVKLETLPELSYPDLQDNLRSSQEWQDKIVVLNFWATWCPPCRKEIPHFIELQDAHREKVQFIGLAIDDKEAVAEFADSMGINYPTLLGDMQAIGLSRQLGNRLSGLPFTAVFDRNGKLVHQQIGEISRDDLETLFSRFQ